MRFDGKVALITAAGAGIGKASAEIMAREGATVIAVDTDADRLATLEAAFTDSSTTGKVLPKQADALSATSVSETVAWAEQTCGRIDILVNGVGGSTIISKPAATVDELSLEDWQSVVAFNLDGTYLFSNAVVPIMKRQESGKIVNLASIAGRGISISSSSAYAAAKGGIIAFTKKLALEVGPYGINVNAIAPSVTLTERITPHWEARDPDIKAAELARIPLGRIAESSDQAKVLCFLASSDADFVTGVTIDVTGGV